MPDLPLYLRCISRFSWLTCTFLPTQPRSITAPPLDERFGLACIVEGRIPFHQGTRRSLQGRRKTPGWSHTNTVARWTLCHLGHNNHRHRYRLLFEQHCILRRLSSRSGGITEGGEIRRNCCPISFCSTCFETFGPINQAGCDFFFFFGPLSFSCLRQSS